MDVTRILEPLNDAQRDAVASENQNMLVLAGAGSGKTRVLVHRIAWLVQAEGFSPWAIMAVTFTNKAAREMRSRIEDMLQISTHGMWVGTFHGLAHRLLKAHWHEAGLPQNFQILDSDDQWRLVKRICRELDLDEGRWPPRQAQWYINGQKDEGLRSAHIEAPASDPYAQVMLRVYQAYEAACERAGMVDFAELLLRAHELWLKNPELLAHYQGRFRYLLVDEFQDTNTIQYAWLRVLAGKTVPIVAVGDDDQSIYGWRGARIENIQRFSDDFAPVHTVRLEQNYRSTSTILEAANAVITHNASLFGDGEVSGIVLSHTPISFVHGMLTIQGIYGLGFDRGHGGRCRSQSFCDNIVGDMNLGYHTGIISLVTDQKGSNIVLRHFFRGFKDRGARHDAVKGVFHEIANFTFFLRPLAMFILVIVRKIFDGKNADHLLILDHHYMAQVVLAHGNVGVRHGKVSLYGNERTGLHGANC